ncbi:hypothetical protein CBR_g12041 [Chara braunii]|uniref:Tubulin--tyrosine ligase-like protein 12 SET-like domain-containing protein n=1 Tax=Chara braunii TaxID=69332 RepID=A0A388KR02_CHABU|nr:hypothetical protein CBR_g12041 [Chara braunii]|eukprot:GBG72467.1 hypothetical protein CBR_g12041 [Chara braunii]
MAIMMGVAEVGSELEEEEEYTADDEDGEEDTGTSARKSVESALAEAEREAADRGTEVLWLELDDLGIDDEKLCSLNLSRRYPSLIGLSLWGNKITTVDGVVEAVAGMNQLRALWLNNNPVEKERWHKVIATGVIRLEIFNAEELPSLETLNLKGNPLKEQSRDELLGILGALPNLQYLQVDVPSPLGWTLDDITDNLPSLLEINNESVEEIRRKSSSVTNGSIDDLEPRLPEWSQGEPVVDRVLRSMWQYVQEYRLATEEKLDETPIWYIMDEFGSSLRHSDVPNFKCVPFMYMPDGTLQSAISFSLLWPTQDLQRGDECFRDYLSGITEQKHRSSRLTAWYHTPRSFFRKAFEAREDRLTANAAALEERPSLAKGPGKTSRSIRKDDQPLKIYTDNPQVLDALKRPEFQLVKEPKEADIVWSHAQVDDEFRKALELRDDQYVNQFPYEACIVMKHHLAQTMMKAYGRKPWLQVTYELDSEVPAMIGDFQQREESGTDNLWILKPWNMARSIDSVVTRNLCAIIRIMETGPKICQKYIERPALYKGKKFDLRYILLVRSINPLDIFVGDMFWSRLSNNTYSTNEAMLSDYETHFTVMNYVSGLNHVNTNEFVSEFEKEHGVSWADIDERVKAMFREVFEGAAMVQPDMHCEYARAIYGCDVMLDENMQPKLLEVTYCPDCTRGFTFEMTRLSDGAIIDPKEFYNTIFGCLFLDERKNVTSLYD